MLYFTYINSRENGYVREKYLVYKRIGVAGALHMILYKS